MQFAQSKAQHFPLAPCRCESGRICSALHRLDVAKHAAKVAPAIVAAVRNREPLADPKPHALVTFTRKVVEQRGFVSETEVAAFLGAGYTRAQLVEVLFGVGMKTFNNYVDHIAHTPLNDQFKAEAWRSKRRAS